MNSSIMRNVAMMMVDAVCSFVPVREIVRKVSRKGLHEFNNFLPFAFVNLFMRGVVRWKDQTTTQVDKRTDHGWSVQQSRCQSSSDQKLPVAAARTHLCATLGRMSHMAKKAAAKKAAAKKAAPAKKSAAKKAAKKK